MDFNYKCDKLGKFFMGMDLILVYEEVGDDQEIGIVNILSDVVNNFGVCMVFVICGQMDVFVNIVGYVQYDEDYLIYIYLWVEGWIEKFYVKVFGDLVEQGVFFYVFYLLILVNVQEELFLVLKCNNVMLIEVVKECLVFLQVLELEIN